MSTSCRCRRLVPALSLFAVFLAATPASPEPHGALQPGDVLNQSNWQAAEGLLPPEVLDHYKKGEYANPIVAWSEDLQHWGQDFLRGTEENRGRLKLDESGTIVDKTTGKQPPYIIGFPFPDLDPQDPQAALKILWDHYYQYWYGGNNLSTASLEWINPTGFEHRSIQDVRYLFYDGQPRELSPAENPHNLLLQFLAKTVEPADLYGTAALDWRFRDGDKRDLVWAYVPALRRVRQVSPANRSDGFLGSDLSQDDGAFFDGKPQDFTWKLVGETEQLILRDPYSLRGEFQYADRPGGGWSVVSKDVPRFGYQLPNWSGLAWAPVSHALAKSKVWVIEGIPKDRYYLYGKIQLSFVKGTLGPGWNRKFDWKGELVNVYCSGEGGRNHSPDGKNWIPIPAILVEIAENVRMHRATVAEAVPGLKVPFSNFRIPGDPSMFEYQELLRVGK